METTMNTIEVQDVSEPGWYMSADPRLNESIIYRLSNATIDGSLQWYAMFDNGEGGPCEPGYVDQAGPVVRVSRPQQPTEEAVEGYHEFHSTYGNRILCTVMVERDGEVDECGMLWSNAVHQAPPTSA